MTIAITGATGQLGRLAIAALKARVPAAGIIALVRDPAKAADLGVEARAFDYWQAEAQIDALKGVDVLALISSNDFNDRPGQHARVIAAAKAAGVKRILYTSIVNAETSGSFLAQDHRTTEKAILASGLAYTFLRNGWYTENYAGGFAHAIASGTLVGASGAGKISAAARADYAEALAVAASTEGHDDKAYELAGDNAFTLADLAAELSHQSGKPVAFQNLPEDVYAGILVQVGLPEGAAKIIADAETHTAKGALFDGSKTLSTLIGRPTTPMPETVKALLG